MKRTQVLIIGGGASGMIAAITAAKAGKKVLLIEKMNRLGKKILATGNGKCNFTNRYQEKCCYRGGDIELIWNALQHFPAKDVLNFFHDIGILPKEREGYYYPASGQASSVLEALLRQLIRYEVQVHSGEQVTSIEPGFQVTSSKDCYRAENVILAVGGQAAPVHGTTGDGYDIAKKLGLEVVTPLPALTSCVLKGNFMKEWSGVRVQGEISLYEEKGYLLAKDQGELQMVAYGISGIPVFQISRYAAKALHQGKKPYLEMDIMPEYCVEELIEELESRRKKFAQWKAIDAMDGMMHRKLAHVLLVSLGMSQKQLVGQWTDLDIHKMADRMKNWKLGIESVSGFDKAQVTCGGVALGQIDPHTMEVKAYPGLYLTGELLDVDGICGGYNLQWAWTSGYLAGSAVSCNHKK